MNTPPAGWYPNPDPNEPGSQRYWNGTVWTPDARPIPAPQQPRPQDPTMAPQVRPGQAPVSPTQAGQPVPPQPGPGRPKVSFFGARKQAESLIEQNEALTAQNAELQRVVAEVGAMDIVERERRKADLEAEIARKTAELDAEIARKTAEHEAQVGRHTAEVSTADAELERVRGEIVTVRVAADLQDAGIYEYHHPAESSVQHKEMLDEVRGLIKDMIRTKAAATKSENFTYNNSKTEGKKFVRDLHDMMLAAYNAEAENCVKSVKAGNLAAAVARLEKARERIAKRGTWIGVGITDRYHRHRVMEMELSADYWKMKEEEKEAERARREELREQKKAEQELAREKEKLEKERQHYLNLVAALEANGDTEALEKARAELAEAERAIEDVDYRAANQRAGYVYVISNVGAFGDGVVKIGMTRRLEPMDRVNELGDASVPFRFDVHTLFFSADAVAVEAALHRHFADRRVNKVNLRREFFYATPHQVLEALQAQVGAVTECTEDPAADEFRISRGELSATF